MPANLDVETNQSRETESTPKTPVDFKLKAIENTLRAFGADFTKIGNEFKHNEFRVNELIGVCNTILQNQTRIEAKLDLLLGNDSSKRAVHAVDFLVESLVPKSENLEQKAMTFMNFSTVSVRHVLEKTGTFFSGFEFVVDGSKVLLVKKDDENVLRATGVTGAIAVAVGILFEDNYEKSIYLKSVSNGEETIEPLIDVEQFAKWLLVE